MRFFLALLAVSLCLLSSNAEAGETLIGTLTSTGTTVTNATTSVPFTVGADSKLSVQCDAGAYLRVCSATETCTATATNAVKLAADQLFSTSAPSHVGSDHTAKLAIISVSGTANCRVFTRRGNEN
jgi:hypothetical protein